MWICLECGEVFEDPIRWTEDRGEYFGASAYEEFEGSPCCYGNYTEAYRCDECDEWITDEYIKVGDKRYCQECCRTYELGEEEMF